MLVFKLLFTFLNRAVRMWQCFVSPGSENFVRNKKINPEKMFYFQGRAVAHAEEGVRP